MSKDTFRMGDEIEVCYSPDSAEECAMIRERMVAGISNDIPACPVHGEYPADA